MRFVRRDPDGMRRRHDPLAPPRADRQQSGDRTEELAPRTPVRARDTLVTRETKGSRLVLEV
jgi:hypothetical protein